MALFADTGLRLHEFVRRPATIVLVLAVPPLAIETYGTALESFPQLPGLAEPARVGRITGTLFAVAFLAGLVGLFQVISSRSGDERLVLCGYSRMRLLGTRLLSLFTVGAVASAVALATLGLRVDVAAPALAFGVLIIAIVLYGLLGVTVGSVLPRELEGSLVLVFAADLDNALSSDLFDTGVVGRFAPLHHPHALFESAVVSGELAGDHLLPTMAYLIGFLVVAVVAYTRAGVRAPRS